MITARAQVTVRYAETDMMGIVYHANYLPWFEVARTQLLREQGFPYRQLESDGYRIPVLEVSAKYRRPALYDDTLTIVATIREKPLLRIRIAYEVFRGEELLATGESAHAFCDLTGRPTRPPPAFVARMNAVFTPP
ncbi:MAG: thioesterase family protein [Verrucomicrobia bacterium]|nr:thioesterase family protein [Verrucomicrobiota bacterium]